MIMNLVTKDNVVMKRFNENCMLVKIGIKLPGSKQLVIRASQEAANTFKADVESIDSHIRKFRKSDLAPAQEVATSARSKLKFFTSTWDDHGWRICKTEFWPDLSRELEELKLKFTDAVNQIVNKNYEEIKADAQRRAGDLWEDIRFPEKDEFSTQFAFVIEIDEIKDPKDVKISGPSGLIKEVQQHMEERNETKLKEAQSETLERVQGVLADTVSRLKHYDAGKAKFSTAKKNGGKATKVRISDTVIDNVVEVAKVIKNINLTDNDELDKASNKLVEVFSKFQGNGTMKELRDDPKKRKEVIKEADGVTSILQNINL
jgi:hypothetical protein